MGTEIGMNTIISFGLNAGLVTIAWFFIKRMIVDLESKASINAQTIAKNREEIDKEIERNRREVADELKRVTVTTTLDIKSAILENRMEYKDRTLDIMKRLDPLSQDIVSQNDRIFRIEIRQEQFAAELKLQEKVNEALYRRKGNKNKNGRT
jgi:flagellar motility protein MotE (MotC chaperone)